MATETVTALDELTSPASNDEIGIWDVSAGQYMRITRANLVGGTITGGGTVATGGYTLTVPATGTAALLGTAQTFSAAQTFSNALVAPGMKPASDSTTALQLQKSDGSAVLTVDTTNGFVGINTTSASETLEVAGNILLTYNATPKKILFERSDGVNTGQIYMEGPASDLRLNTQSSVGTIALQINSATQVFLNTTGLGIGTATPSTRLDVDAGAIEFAEMTAPSAGASNTARLFCRDNGSGKSQLCVIFATGAIQVLATEP